LSKIIIIIIAIVVARTENTGLDNEILHKLQARRIFQSIVFIHTLSNFVYHF